MDVNLSIKVENLSDEKLQSLTRELSRTLNRQPDIDVTLAEISGTTGAKGDAITVGTMVLTFLGSGAAVALINVLKSYFERNKAIEVELQDKDGRRLKIKADNVRSEQEINNTIKLARKFFGD